MMLRIRIIQKIAIIRTIIIGTTIISNNKNCATVIATVEVLLVIVRR